MKRHLVHIIPDFNSCDGIFNYVSTLVLYCDKQKYENTIISFLSFGDKKLLDDLKKNDVNTFQLGPALYEKTGNKYIRYFLKNFIIAFIRKYLSLKQILETVNPDLIFVHGENAELICGFLNSFSFKVNVLHSENSFPQNLVYKYILYNYSRKNYYSTIIVNEKLKSILRNPTMDVYRVPVGIIMEKYSSVKEVLHQNNKDVTFGYIGRISREKNIQNLINAFIKTADKYGYVNLIIAGNGNHKPVLEKMIPHYLKQNIKFVGAVEKTEEFFNNIDVLVHPSPSEGGPITVLEGLAAKRIVIAADVGFVKDILKDNINGLLLKDTSVKSINEKMEYVIANYDQIIKLADNASELLSQYDYKNFLTTFYSVSDVIYSKIYNK